LEFVVHAEEEYFILALENFLLHDCSIREFSCSTEIHVGMPGRHILCDVQAKHKLRCLNAFPCRNTCVGDAVSYSANK